MYHHIHKNFHLDLYTLSSYNNDVSVDINTKCKLGKRINKAFTREDKDELIKVYADIFESIKLSLNGYFDNTSPEQL